MRIAEIFYSVQGEGELTGVPSVFIRTSGCNLRCTWCDTPYASWTPTGESQSLQQIVDTVRRHPARHCVLTGGEPMIAPGIHELAAALHELDYHITIETAGTIAPGGVVCDLASISPKLPNSTPPETQFGAAWNERHEATRWQPEIVRQWLEGGNYQLKFVISDEGDLAAAQALVKETGLDVPPSKILLMPEGKVPALMHARELQVVEMCKTHGYRYCSRLHLQLFGNTPGT